MAAFTNVDDYISSFPVDVQQVLEAVRLAIRVAAPGTEETISYQMPTITLNGKYLVYFGGWKHHIGLYPVPKLDDVLEREVSKYRSAKDTLRFPLGEPVPYDLVTRVVSYVMEKRRSEKR